jgi:hypothetical protein
MAKSGPSRNPIFSNAIRHFEAPGKKKSSSVERQPPYLPAQSALSSAFMAKNAFLKTRIWLESRFNDYRLFKLKYHVEDRVFLLKKSGLWTYKKTSRAIKFIIFSI